MRRLLTGVLLLVLLPAGLLFVAMVVAYVRADRPEPVPRTTAEDPDLPSLTLHGYRFHLETRGKEGAPVVVVLPGGPGADYQYLLPLTPLAAQYRLVFYDQRGCGLSPRVPPGELTFEQFLADLEAVIDHFSPRRPVRLIGHSWGGMLAAAYLARHPERVSHAVLAEPGFLTPELGNHFVRELEQRTEFSFAALCTALDVGAQALKLPVGDGDEDARPDFLALALAQADVSANPMRDYYCGGKLEAGSMPIWRFGVRATMTLLESGRGEDGTITADFSRGLERYQREVLLIASSCNQVMGVSVQEQHRALFPQARLVVMQNVGHTMFGEDPGESVRIISDYFGRP